MRDILLLGTTNEPPLVLVQPFFFRGNVVYVVALLYQLMKPLSIPPHQRFSAIDITRCPSKIIFELLTGDLV